MRYINTASSEALSYAGFFRLTFTASPYSDQSAALQSAYDAIPASGLVFPTINYPGATGGIMVVDVRVKTGAESATVGQMATELDSLEWDVSLESVERIDRHDVTSPAAPADREQRKNDVAGLLGTNTLTGELAAIGHKLFLVLLLVGIGFALLEANKLRRAIT